MVVSEACCPGGLCRGDPEPSCESANGVAFAGHRYRELARQFDAGCSDDPASGDACNLCVDALNLAPLSARVSTLVPAFCLPQVPACLVTRDGQLAACDAAEAAEADNYALRVMVSCERAVAEGGGCEAEVPARVLGPEEYSIEVGAEGCAALLRLRTPPPFGAVVDIEFLPGR